MLTNLSPLFTVCEDRAKLSAKKLSPPPPAGRIMHAGGLFGYDA